MEIFSDHSFLWSALVALLGVFLTLWLYKGAGAKQTFLLVLRLCTVALVSFLVANPYLYDSMETTLESKTLVLVDESLSVDSLERQGVKDKLEPFLTSKNVSVLTFSDGLRSNTNKSTNIYKTLDEVFNQEKQNLGKIVLISDGISNKGSNPAYNIKRYTVPIYTIALGDSTQKIDAQITQIDAPTEAENKALVPLDVVIKAPKSKKTITLNYRIGKEKGSETINLSNGIGRWSKNVNFSADEKEFMTGEFSLELLENEVNKENNSRKIFIKQKRADYRIDMVYDAMHPDIGVWVRALKGLNNTDVKIIPQSTYKTKPEANALVIQFLYLASSPVLENAAVHVVGSKKLRSGKWGTLPISFTDAQETSYIVPIAESFNNIFSFSLGDEINSINYKGTPFPFGSLGLITEHQNLLSQGVDGMTTDTPLLSHYKKDNRAKGIYFGEGLWQFNTNYNTLSDQPDTKALEQLLSAFVNYLQKSSGVERLEITEPLEVIANENQVWTANYINQNNEKVSSAEIDLQILNDAGKTVAQYVLFKQSNFYQANVTGLPAGIYTYAFSGKNQQKILTKNVRVVADEQGLEQQNLQANFDLLRLLANSTKGDFVMAKDVDENFLKRALSNNGVERVLYKNKKRYCAEFKGIWLVLLILLCSEWLLRRQRGLI